MVLSLPCLALVLAGRAAADFVILPPVGGGTHSEGNDISADGSVVVGISTGSLNRGVIWTRSGASYTGTSLGVVSGATDSYAYGVSADGQVVVGYGNRAGFSRATRWTQATGQVEPLSATWAFSTALGVSDDGNTFVAYVNTDASSPYRAVRVQGTGASQTVQQLQSYVGTLNGSPYVHDFATAVSGDGRVSAGYATVQNLSGERPLVWDASGNYTPIGDSSFFGHAYAASGSGSVIVGEGTFPFGMGQSRLSFRWTAAGGLQSLGTLSPTGQGSEADDVSQDGTVVVGRSGITIGVSDAFVWTQATGMQDLNTLLATQGVSTAGWTLTRVWAISGDPVAGYNLSGTAVMNGATDGFVLTGFQLPTSVPEPSPLSLLGFLFAGLLGWTHGARFLGWRHPHLVRKRGLTA